MNGVERWLLGSFDLHVAQKGQLMLRRTMTVGSIAGIHIRFHWSWLVVLVLIVGMLSQVYTSYANRPVAWVMAVSAVLLLCASVVLHELGHALVARRYRLPVIGITLFALGGVTEIADDRPEPVRELLIAVTGPAISLILALICGLVWWGGSTHPSGVVALHLALTNSMMAIFNLLPGYPLDGGRVLRAVIWFLTDAELPAARVAAVIGRACGWLVVFAGAVYTIGVGDIINGTWIALIGYFLTRSAAIGYRQLVLQRILSDISVADLMQRAYRAVAPELPLDQFVGRYILGQTDQGFPVLQRPDVDAPQPLLGMITLRNLRRFQLSEWAFTHVGEAMTPVHRVSALAPGMPAGEAFRALMESGEEQLPVIDGNALLGVLRRRDLFRYIERHMAPSR
jgi:Zn-dependent protease/CBS domain-containing protein